MNNLWIALKCTVDQFKTEVNRTEAKECRCKQKQNSEYKEQENYSMRLSVEKEEEEERKNGSKKYWIFM